MLFGAARLRVGCKRILKKGGGVVLMFLQRHALLIIDQVVGFTRSKK